MSVGIDASESSRGRRSAALGLAVARRAAAAVLLVGPPLAFHVFALALEWLEFLRSGMCHSEPPDIPARPCTLSEFMSHGSGSWDVFGLAFVGVTWLPAGLLLCLARWTLTTRVHGRPARAAMWILTALSVAAGALALAAWCHVVSPVLNGGVAFACIAAFWTWSVVSQRRAARCCDSVEV